MTDQLSASDVTAVVACLGDEEAGVRRAAIKALATMSKQLKKEDLPGISQLLAHGHDDDKAVVYATLKRLYYAGAF